MSNVKQHKKTKPGNRWGYPGRAASGFNGPVDCDRFPLDKQPRVSNACTVAGPLAMVTGNGK